MPSEPAAAPRRPSLAQQIDDFENEVFFAEEADEDAVLRDVENAPQQQPRSSSRKMSLLEEMQMVDDEDQAACHKVSMTSHRAPAGPAPRPAARSSRLAQANSPPRAPLQPREDQCRRSSLSALFDRIAAGEEEVRLPRPRAALRCSSPLARAPPEHAHGGQCRHVGAAAGRPADGRHF
jgi:hypothetical protein